jgi:hypothetical protein
VATVAEVEQLRLMIAEPDDTTYTDAMLGALLDGYAGGTLPLSRAARDIWYQKAASYADLVDISEGGSQRKNGDLHKRALTMAELYAGQADAEDNGSLRATRIARLTRG